MKKGDPVTAQRLKTLREDAGLSMRELARKIGQDHSNVRYWEQSGSLPRSDVLGAMAKALNVSVNDLLGQEEEPSRSPKGKLGQIVETIQKLHRREQEKALEHFEIYLRGLNTNEKKA